MNHIKLIAAIGLTALIALPVAAQSAPERTSVTIGLPVTTSTFLPLYLADAQGFFEAEGVDVEIVAFRGGTDLVRGMIAGAVDIGVTSLAGVNVGIAAEQPIRAFYGGFNMAIFDWYAIDGVATMSDARGMRFGVTRIGSSTDFLTRYAMMNQGMNPETDAQIIQGGGSPERLAAMEAGQLDVNIFATPENFMAEDAGFHRIMRQRDIAPDYPFHVFFATQDFIASDPGTIRAVLRAIVRGVRAAKADRDLAVSVLVDRVGMTAEYSGRAYDDFIDGIFEDGRLPSDEGMDAFWEIGIMSGEYEAAWTLEQFWDPTFVNSFSEWAPPAQ